MGLLRKAGSFNRQKHGKLCSSSCLQQLEGHGADSPLETQPKQSFLSRPIPSQLQEISASFMTTNRRHHLERSLRSQERGLGPGPVQFFPELL